MCSSKLVVFSLVAGCLLFPLAAETSAQAQTATAKAWTVLEAGVGQKSSVSRVIAVRVLSLIPQDSHALKIAENALNDHSPLVRAAAATALGVMHAPGAAPELKRALNDKDLHVVLAAAHALALLNDPSCYEVFYAILTGERKNKEGLIAQQLEVLHDPKQLEEMGFNEGIGYIPFAGIGWDALETILKDRKNGDVAKAALISSLATDPDVRSTNAIVAATQHDNWILRVAALEAIAKHGDPSLLPKIEQSIDDKKDEVKYTGAAAIIHLSDLAQARHAANLSTEPRVQAGQ